MNEAIEAKISRVAYAKLRVHPMGFTRDGLINYVLSHPDTIGVSRGEVAQWLDVAIAWREIIVRNGLLVRNKPFLFSSGRISDKDCEEIIPSARYL